MRKVGDKMPLFGHTEQPTTTWFQDWQLFSYEHGSYLLHVPTANILSIDAATATHLQSERKSNCQQNLQASLDDLAKSFARVATDRMREAVDIRSIALNVVQSCNLRCTYCYAGDGDYGANSTMSFETAKTVIDQFADGKDHFSIAFFGGEPLLSFRLIKQVVAYCRSVSGTKFHFSMTTNATLLNEPMMDFFQSEKFRLTVSYDGKNIQSKQRLLPNKKDHAEQLVKKKMEKFASALKQIRGFAIRGTIRKEFLKELPEAIFDVLNSTKFRFHFNRHASDQKSEAFNHQDVALVDTALSAVINKLINQHRFEDLLRIGNLKAHMSAFHRGKRNENVCGAGLNYLSVSTSGGFYLCHRFTEDQSAQIGDVNRGLDLSALQKYGEHRLIEHDPCKSCWMRQWCGGGCFHENRLANKDDFKPDEVFCALQNVEMQHAMFVYTTIQKLQPELLEHL